MQMSRFARTAVLATAFAGLSLGATTISTAQDKTAPKAGKKVVGRIEIREGRDEKFRFFIYGDDKLIAMTGGSGLATKADAEKAVDELRAILTSTTKISPSTKKDDDKMDEPKGKKGGKDKDEMEKDDAPPKKKKPE